MAQIEAYRYFASLKKKKKKEKKRSPTRDPTRDSENRPDYRPLFFLVRVGFQTAKPN